jgi:hypothetical protein
MDKKLSKAIARVVVSSSSSSSCWPLSSLFRQEATTLGVGHSTSRIYTSNTVGVSATSVRSFSVHKCHPSTATATSTATTTTPATAPATSPAPETTAISNSQKSRLVSKVIL